MTYTASDVTAHAVHTACRTLEWATDSLASKGFDTDSLEFAAILEVSEELRSAAGLVTEYSDGRPTMSVVQIGPGAVYVHIWDYRSVHVAGERIAASGPMPADPGCDNGSYVIYEDRSRCGLRIEHIDPPPG